MKPTGRGALAALLLVFLATRVGGAWLADHPDAYRGGEITVTGDVDRYEHLADDVVRGGGAAYDTVPIEYPPGSLPFMWAPLAVDGWSYRTVFIAVMVVLDAAGLAGAVVMARRGGSWGGPWTWTLLVPLLGPVVYCRLDMVPAVATIWAFERAQARRWFGAGALLGVGAAVKVYPAVLLVVALANRWRSRLLVGAAVAVAAAVLPFAGTFAGVWDSVVAYHAERGVQVESTASAVLLAAGHLDRPVEIVLDHGAFHTRATGAGLLSSASSVMAVAVLALAAWSSRARAREDAFGEVVAVAFGTLALLLAVGPVFSPQFMLWLSALGAVAATSAAPARRASLALLAAANLLTQVLFPFRYAGLLANEAGPLALLLLRNTCVAAIGALVFTTIIRGRRGRRHPAPGDRDDLTGPAASAIDV